MLERLTLPQFLQNKQSHCSPALVEVLNTLTTETIQIAHMVRQGALANIFGSANSENIQGETQKKLDVIANDRLTDALLNCQSVAAVASEEMDNCQIAPYGQHHPYLVLFDPLDGSSNIDVNVSIGTIFSILKNPAQDAINNTTFLQPGRQQVAAGYVVYGPQTTLVFSIGQGVEAFTLDNNSFIHTHSQIQIPADTQEFAINMSNVRHWYPPIQRYIQELLAGETGPRGKNFNMRWIASMVADVHRILSRGGTFMYPQDQREPGKPGKLRLMYEANPMSFLVEQAGGKAFSGSERILDIQPQQLHQRCAVMLGSANEVERLADYHLKA